MRKIIILLSLLAMIQFSFTANSCFSACGSNSVIGCSDFALGTNDPNSCYTCGYGFIGGGGNSVAKERTGTCNVGSCNSACKACYDQTDLRCYICAAGYFDPVNNPQLATPCKKCHESCFTCGATSGSGASAVTNEFGCYLCAPGWIDLESNPYVMSSCTKCAEECVACSGAVDKCTACKEGFYSTNEMAGGECLPKPESASHLVFAIQAFFLAIIVALLL